MIFSQRCITSRSARQIPNILLSQSSYQSSATKLLHGRQIPVVRCIQCIPTYCKETNIANNRFQHFSTYSPCPFRTLGIPKEALYTTAKKSFLKVAMDNHPDIVNQRFQNENLTDDLSEEQLQEYNKKKEAYLQNSIERFHRAKKAFDELVEVEDGYCSLRIEVEAEEELKKNQMTDAEFDKWFLNETGHANPYNFDIDPATAREVAEVTSTMGGGLDRDGGMWTLANMISEGVKGGTKDVLKLEQGEIKEGLESENKSSRRRRRKR